MTSNNKFVAVEMNNADVPADAAAILVTARAGFAIIKGGTRREFTGKQLQDYLAANTISARLTVKYAPVDGMSARNQSVCRILRPASTNLDMKGGMYRKGGAETVFELVVKAKAKTTYQLHIRLDQLPSVFEGAYSNAFPIPVDITPATGSLRKLDAARIPANISYQVASNFVMRVSHEALSDGHQVPGVLIPVWTKGAEHVSAKRANQLEMFGSIDKPEIGEVRTDAEGNDWTFVNKLFSPIDSPVYSTEYVLYNAGYALFRQVNPYRKNYVGFVSAADMFAQVIPGVALELPEIKPTEGTFSVFSPDAEGIAELQARRNSAKAAAAPVEVAAEVNAEEVLDF